MMPQSKFLTFYDAMVSQFWFHDVANVDDKHSGLIGRQSLLATNGTIGYKNGQCHSVKHVNRKVCLNTACTLTRRHPINHCF